MCPAISTQSGVDWHRAGSRVYGVLDWHMTLAAAAAAARVHLLA